MNYPFPNANKPELVVIDTNIIVSAFISFQKNYQHSPSAIILNNIYKGKINPVYSDAILGEYEEVLSRPKLKVSRSEIDTLLEVFKSLGYKSNPPKAEIYLVDIDDLPFYEAFLDVGAGGAYLITGNLKHFPAEPFIINPRDALTILDLS